MVILGIILIGVAVSWLVLQKHGGEQPQIFETAHVPTQNPYLQEYNLPTGAGPNGLVVDNNGTVWVTSSKYPILYSFDPISGQFDDHEIKDNSISYSKGANTTMVWTMVQESNGIIWFSPLGTNTIWRFNPADNSFHAMNSVNGSAFQMKIDPQNGDVWYTTLSGDSLDVVEKDPATTDGYAIKSFYLGNGTAPAGLYLENGHVWVTEITSQKMVEYRIIMKNGSISGIAKLKDIPQDNKTQLSSPTDLVVGKDSIWLTEHGTSFITHYLLGNDAVLRYPTSQNTYHATTLPFWLRPVSDGQYIWFNEHEGNKVALFDIVNKTMTEYEIPSRPQGGILTYPLNIAIDPSDNMILWFSEWNTDKLGKVDGHVPIPFSISADTSRVVLSTDASKEVTVNLTVDGKSPASSNMVFLNASSSMDPAAGFGNADASITPDTLDLTSENHAQLVLRNYSEQPGNYTLGISVSNGIVTRTIFLDLVVPKG